MPRIYFLLLASIFFITFISSVQASEFKTTTHDTLVTFRIDEEQMKIECGSTFMKLEGLQLIPFSAIIDSVLEICGVKIIDTLEVKVAAYDLLTQYYRSEKYLKSKNLLSRLSLLKDIVKSRTGLKQDINKFIISDVMLENSVKVSRNDKNDSLFIYKQYYDSTNNKVAIDTGDYKILDLSKKFHGSLKDISSSIYFAASFRNDHNYLQMLIKQDDNQLKNTIDYVKHCLAIRQIFGYNFKLAEGKIYAIVEAGKVYYVKAAIDEEGKILLFSINDAKKFAFSSDKWVIRSELFERLKGRILPETPNESSRNNIELELVRMIEFDKIITDALNGKVNEKSEELNKDSYQVGWKNKNYILTFRKLKHGYGINYKNNAGYISEFNRTLFENEVKKLLMFDLSDELAEEVAHLFFLNIQEKVNVKKVKDEILARFLNSELQVGNLSLTTSEVELLENNTFVNSMKEKVSAFKKEFKEKNDELGLLDLLSFDGLVKGNMTLLNRIEEHIKKFKNDKKVKNDNKVKKFKYEINYLKETFLTFDNINEDNFEKLKNDILTDIDFKQVKESLDSLDEHDKDRLNKHLNRIETAIELAIMLKPLEDNNIVISYNDKTETTQVDEQFKTDTQVPYNNKSVLAQIEDSEIYKDYAKVVDYYLKLDSVALAFENGSIKDLKVTGHIQKRGSSNSSGKPIYFRNTNSISVRTPNDITKLSILGEDQNLLINEWSEDKEFRIDLANFFNYNRIVIGGSGDYVPENSVIILKPKNNERETIPLVKTTFLNNFDVRIYTDLSGLSIDNPNGLVQTEASYRGYLNTQYAIRCFSKYTLFFNYLEPFITFSKIEEDDSKLPIRKITLSDSITQIGHLSTFDLYQYSTVRIGVRANPSIIYYTSIKNKNKS